MQKYYDFRSGCTFKTKKPLYIVEIVNLFPICIIAFPHLRMCHLYKKREIFMNEPIFYSP